MSTLTVHAVLVADGWGVADADAEVRFVRVAGITRPLCACGGGLFEPTKKPLPLAESTVLAGGDEEDRTPDLRIANATLSQLSYVPTFERILAAHRVKALGGCRSDLRDVQTLQMRSP